jgi:hypothetical protein
MIVTGAADVDERGDSDIRYLCLCRVLLGKILVSDDAPGLALKPVKEGGEAAMVYSARGRKAAQLSSGLAQYDSIYSPALEEYVVMNPLHVLPEFLIQFKFVARDAEMSGESDQANERYVC